ncbi:MAG: helix-turn-helix transcriptional regulator [Candidatus Magasanikbacteria bacterium]|jgi:transcriptional regulator with XRE-family HTH domain|nr:helix-turn-helix transcriptional regulator [Candidatus Magasanikbacteria bacterium]
MSKIAKIIKQLREEAGLSATDLHRRSGLSLAYISKLEDGQYDELALRLKTAKSLSTGLGLTLRHFFERIGVIEGNDNSPSLYLLKTALRSDGGLSVEQADNVLKYVDFIKSAPRDSKV